MFISRVELLPAGERTEDHRKLQMEEADLVEKDKASHAEHGGGLFKGRFKSTVPYRPPIRDDGVDRCPVCTWEIEDGICGQCGYSVYLGHEVASFDSDDDSYSTFTDQLLADHHMAQDHFGADDTGYDYDSIDSEFEDRRHASRLRCLEEQRRRRGLARLGAPTEMLQRLQRAREETSNLSQAATSDNQSFDDSEESSFDDSEEERSLDNFIVGDDTVNGGDANSQSSLREPDSGHDSSRSDNALEIQDSMDSSSTDDSDVRPTAYQRRPRGHRITTISSDSSDSGHSGFSPSSNNSRRGRNQTRAYGGFSPLQQESNGETSQQALIEIGSDSDASPVRHTRKRRAALSISSNEDSHVARVLSTDHLRGRESSDDTAIGGIAQPQETYMNHGSGPQNSSDIHRGHSPIVINSSPTRPTSSIPVQSSHRCKRPALSNYSTPSPSGASRDTLPSGNERISPKDLARRIEQVGRQSPQHEPPELGPLPPRSSSTIGPGNRRSQRAKSQQRRAARRKRDMQERQARRQPDIEQSSESMNTIAYPQQLAYVGM